ncbi:TYW1 [Symbiodinium sp. KB8]|nr:TYW1 [Symbiodinium sp. KB8]
MDEPEVIVSEAVERHQAMIKELKGVPGVKIDRWNEAFTVRHCALSLVGEPIMYPRINEMLRLLHARGISSFLVTNAQFPEAIEKLEPVTQLYVSVDAATKESLRAIDRPLFKDFWTRFLRSLEMLKKKGQRTVYRLTLVKEFNMTEVADYCNLIELGAPDFIEIKAVTYCGKSDGSSLTMKHVPWHEEVKAFAAAIAEKTNGKYGLAAEHEHSNCTLLAKQKFKIDGEWHTWIDYDKFSFLINRWHQTGESFSSMDYIAKTPQWALWDAPEGGFDPIEQRFRRTRDGKKVENSYEPSESGCG